MFFGWAIQELLESSKSLVVSARVFVNGRERDEHVVVLRQTLVRTLVQLNSFPVVVQRPSAVR